MPNPTLSAVPPQGEPRRPHPRSLPFRKHLISSLQDLHGPDAVEAVMRAYDADMGALQARLEAAQIEASQASNASRTHYTMLQNVHVAASHGLWERAELAAELCTFKNITDDIRRLADRSEDGTVDVALIHAALTQVPAEAIRQPVVTAFVASSAWSTGLFKAPEGDVTLIWPFAGYALVDHGPGANGSIEPTFIVGDKIIPKCVVETQNRVTFERLQPHAYPAAAHAA